MAKRPANTPKKQAELGQFLKRELVDKDGKRWISDLEPGDGSAGKKK